LRERRKKNCKSHGRGFSALPDMIISNNLSSIEARSFELIFDLSEIQRLIDALIAGTFFPSKHFSAVLRSSYLHDIVYASRFSSKR
jgi:hypothetical protein